MVSASESASSPSPPPLGTYIDNESLQLVEVLGYGGYGVVYRAIDTCSSSPTSYAVKCLPRSHKRNAQRQHQLHMREIRLHQVASRHPNVVTLHRVIEDYHYTYIVMEYCQDGDLFSQILHHRRYLGRTDLIKEVFLQLLDAVEYCHSMHIYHRDLKPENILCFDRGLRLAITDFGLATTEEESTEFRTGSVYHMSPECQGSQWGPRSYSPRSNDIWSLGIILLNLITGRNPWKSAAYDDCTFQAYLRNPMHFLPTVLPISEEVNILLTRTLEVDYHKRISLQEMRRCVERITNFYSPDVLFEDSMARCPWEAGLNVDGDADAEGEVDDNLSAEESEPRAALEDEGYTSTWSDADSEMVFAPHPETDNSSWTDSESYATRRDSYSRSMSPSPTSPLFTTTKLFDATQTPSSPSMYSVVSTSPSIPSLPATPGLDAAWSQPANKRPSLKLTLDTNGCQPQYYDHNVMMVSARSSSMHTALESHVEAYGMYSPFLSATIPEKTSLLFTSPEDIGMITTPATADDGMDVKSTYTYPTIDADNMSATRPESSILGLDSGSRSGSLTAVEQYDYDWEQYSAPSSIPPDVAASGYSFLSFGTTPAPSPQSERAWAEPSYAALNRLPDSQREKSPSPFSFLVSPTSPPPLPFRPTLSPAARDRKTHTSSFLNPIRLAFPRRSASPAVRSSATSPAYRNHATQTESEPTPYTHWAFTQSTSTSPSPQAYMCLPPLEAKETKLVDTQRAGRPSRARAWFSPGKLLAVLLA
ncbi:uncharacterized protein FIBRA_01607 [Fibroporia radiculosa]|uniref:Protein kinase domain-containing protein n=1 Tax=Fibroporia radiculosa TaxID=599839 RepID=J4H1B1_9APHY|nr:uncharacterized protein FIBRA_01607 [Fibroporia radiculosa]CCL99589.1 predicted protein [Fibroporia radiculosa]